MKTAEEILEECKIQLNYLSDKFGKTGTTASVISKIDNFLNESHPTTLPSDANLKKLIWEDWEGEIKEEDPREMVFKYMIWMRSICEAKIAEMEKYKSLVIELAEWSRKYPRDRIYSMRKIKMDDELIALENKAKELTTTP